MCGSRVNGKDDAARCNQPGVEVVKQAEAPPELDEPLAVEFLNTIWHGRTEVHDSLIDEAGLDDWLTRMAARGLLEPIVDLSGDDSKTRLTAIVDRLDDLRLLRGALRVIAGGVTQDHRTLVPKSPMSLHEATGVVNGFAACAPRWARLTWADEAPVATERWGGKPVQNLLAALAAGGITAICDTQTPLRACHAPRCVLFFTQHHRRRQWCSDSCGSRARVARYYARQQASTSP
jgi:predicted RNA-binding Zn ribbon-like protein